jgi:ABC-type multidrug transport system ATPase subunit
VAPEPGGIVLVGVSRRYGADVALAPLSLHVTPGAVCAVTGANGSGKTTLLRIAAGLLTPSTGERRTAGPALYVHAGAGARRRERVAHAVATAARLAGAPDGAVDQALVATGLRDRRRCRAGELSAGQRARLALAVALAARPRVVCLDEPTEHLDQEGREVAAHAVATLATDGAAVLLATHDLAAVGRVDHVLDLVAGRARR